MDKYTIDIITLGCSKNLVDAERLMYRLSELGHTCVHDSDNPQGEIAIINTCGFIGDAKEESIRTILEFVDRKLKTQRSLRRGSKPRHPLYRIYVMGCLSERYLADLESEIPEVDGWFGKFNYSGIISALSQSPSTLNPQPLTINPTPLTFHRTITTPRHYAYLKIAEGCDRYCSYCAIPYITGKFTPRPMDEILDEVRWLVSTGTHEFNVIAQDLTSYPNLAELIDRMALIPGVEWIRLHYAYPTDFPYDILPVMAKHPNVCKYLDIALQHGSDHMLDIMRRHITCAEQTALIQRIRREVPGICIRTTLIVGHPGETEEDFRLMKEWVRQMRFERMGCFTYSHEDGTYAFRHYQDDIPEEVKQRRQDELMAIQQEISSEILAQKVGQTLRVIIDRTDGDYYIGRTEQDSPEVDCEVLIPIQDAQNHDFNGENALSIGEFYNVTINRTEDFDLYATIC